jgi:hypothetical protein
MKSPSTIASVAAAVAAAASAAYAHSGSYAEFRIAMAFQVAAEVPPVAPLAEKGDLMPIGCAGPLRPHVQAECIDTAYELPLEPSTIVETRTGPASSELMRLNPVLVAGP